MATKQSSLMTILSSNTSYDPDPATVCGIHRGRGVPLAVLLVPVLLLLRRRRR